MSPDPVTGVVFVDLDGTLVLDNSYQLLLRAMCSEGTIGLRIGVLAVMAAKALGLRSRVAAKRRVLSMLEHSRRATAERVTGRVLAELGRTVSGPVVRIVRSLQAEGWSAVLATAAPACYADAFAERIGFDDCLATRPVNGSPKDWEELAGHRKVIACQRWIDHSFNDPRAVRTVAITDHVDDVPLLSRVDRGVVQADEAGYAAIRAALPEGQDLRWIDPVGRQPSGGTWLWLNDGPCGPLVEWDARMVLTKHRYALLYVGGARWLRARNGRSLSQAVPRADCPALPSLRQRVLAQTSRTVVRNWLGVFH